MSFFDETYGTNKDVATPVLSLSRSSQDMGSMTTEYVCLPPHASATQNQTFSVHSAHTTEISEPSYRMSGPLSIQVGDEELADAEITTTEISTTDTALSNAQTRIVQELMRRISILENEVLTFEALAKLIENKETISALLRKVRLTENN